MSGKLVPEWYDVLQAMVNVHHMSARRYRQTLVSTIAVCGVLIAVVTIIARAQTNLNAAVTGDPKLAVYELLHDMNPTDVTELRENGDDRDYLVEVKPNSLYLVRLTKNKAGEWEVATKEPLRE